MSITRASRRARPDNNKDEVEVRGSVHECPARVRAVYQPGAGQAVAVGEVAITQ